VDNDAHDFVASGSIQGGLVITLFALREGSEGMTRLCYWAPQATVEGWRRHGDKRGEH
jgi:hypothetical protein